MDADHKRNTINRNHFQAKSAAAPLFSVNLALQQLPLANSKSTQYSLILFSAFWRLWI